MLRVYDVESPYFLRELVSSEIRKNPARYAPFVQRPPEEYVRWITDERSWGGAVEISIVARHFNIEIDSVDVQHVATFHFNHPPHPGDDWIDPFDDGSVPAPTARGLVCYTGQHYDLFVFNRSSTSAAATDETLFAMDDPVPGEMALEMCQRMNERGSYADTVETFCKICRAKLVGNHGVLNHGSKTGHYNFG